MTAPLESAPALKSRKNNAVLVVYGALGSMLLAYGFATGVQWFTGTGGPAMFHLAAVAVVLVLILTIAFLRRYLSISQTVSALTVLDVSFISIKLIYLALLQDDRQALVYALSSDFLWTSSTPMLALSMPIGVMARGFVYLQPLLFTGVALAFWALHRETDVRQLYALFQLCLLNWTALFGIWAFNRTLGRLWTARKDNKVLSQLAYHDELTGLLNRRGMERHLQQLLEANQLNGRGVAVIFVDLDGFKPINDTLGHQVGDELLQTVARRLERLTAGWGMAARVSGDEFVVLADIQQPERLMEDASAFHTALSQPVLMQGQRVELTSSAGMSLFPQDGQTVQELLRRADIAMFSVKASGKNGLHFYGSDLHAGIEREQLISRELIGLVSRGELYLAYQPICDIQTGKIRACEVLLRWQHPGLGNISPAQFIPLAEANGSILPIGLWVLRQALNTAAEWQARGLGHLRVAVNVSPLQLLQPDFLEMVQAELNYAGVGAQMLELEITEGLALSDRDATIRLLQRLRALGVTLALDDFGEGFASLSHLRDLPVQHIKMDRSFLAELKHEDLVDNGGRYSSALIQATLQLADALGLEVVAEGVETIAQYAMLRSMGCSLAQGYLFTPPLSKNDLLPFLDNPHQLLIPIVKN